MGYNRVYDDGDIGTAALDLGTGVIVALISLATILGLFMGIRYMQGKPIMPR